MAIHHRPNSWAWQLHLYQPRRGESEKHTSQKPNQGSKKNKQKKKQKKNDQAQRNPKLAGGSRSAEPAWAKCEVRSYVHSSALSTGEWKRQAPTVVSPTAVLWHRGRLLSHDERGHVRHSQTDRGEGGGCQRASNCSEEACGGSAVRLVGRIKCHWLA